MEQSRTRKCDWGAEEEHHGRVSVLVSVILLSLKRHRDQRHLQKSILAGRHGAGAVAESSCLN